MRLLQRQLMIALCQRRQMQRLPGLATPGGDFTRLAGELPVRVRAELRGETQYFAAAKNRHRRQRRGRRSRRLHHRQQTLAGVSRNRLRLAVGINILGGNTCQRKLIQYLFGFHGVP